jgi:hypothetical protein
VFACTRLASHLLHFESFHLCLEMLLAVCQLQVIR